MTHNIRFLPSLAHVLYILVWKDVKWAWLHIYTKAFKKAKDLVSATHDVTKLVKLYCDASPQGVGACLMQMMDGHERPVAHFNIS